MSGRELVQAYRDEKNKMLAWYRRSMYAEWDALQCAHVLHAILSIIQEVLINCFGEAFSDIVGSAPILWYVAQGWGDNEARTWASSKLCIS